VVLSAAAVVGRVVPPAVLVAVAARPGEEVAAALEAAGQARLLVDEEHGYRFAHDVIREVIEGDVGSARHTVLCRRVAAAIEDLYADRLPEQYETLAYQYLRGEVWEKALAYLVKAGDKAVAAVATQEALRFYDRALALCATLGTLALAAATEVGQKRGNVLCYGMGDFVGAATDFERMHTAAAGLGDRRLTGMALAFRGLALLQGHEFEAAEEALQAALGVAADEFEDVRFLASTNLGALYTIINRHAEAAPHLAVAAELAPRSDDPVSQGWWSLTATEVLHWTDRYDDALAVVERWQGVVAASHQIIVLLEEKFGEALARGGKGEYTQALAILDDVIATGERVDEVYVRPRALNTAGWIHGELQDHQRALELNRHSLEVASTIEFADTEVRNNALLNLGDCLMALGRPDEAEEHFRAVERVVRTPRPQDRWMLWRYAQHLFHSYGEVWLARGELEKALAYADECLGLADSSDSRKNIVKARRLRAQVFLAQRRSTEAEAELDSALEMARGVGNPPQLWKTLVTIGELRLAQDRPDDARQAYHEALAVVEHVAGGLHDDGLRATFLTSPPVQHIWQQATRATRAPTEAIPQARHATSECG
jgi:tetratricopeptide (TPR) repeat protein